MEYPFFGVDPSNRRSPMLKSILFLAAFIVSSYAHAGVIGDIDGDGTVGLPEATYALQVLSGVRTPMTTSGSVIRVYDSRQPQQYLGIGASGVMGGASVAVSGVSETMDTLFIPGLSLFTSIYADGTIAAGVLLYETNDCSGNAFIKWALTHHLMSLTGEEYYTGSKAAPVSRQLLSYKMKGEVCRPNTAPGRAIYSVPAVQIPKEDIPFILPVALPLQYVLE
jgi:hypothetical protein